VSPNRTDFSGILTQKIMCYKICLYSSFTNIKKHMIINYNRRAKSRSLKNYKKKKNDHNKECVAILLQLLYTNTYQNIFTRFELFIYFPLFLVFFFYAYNIMSMTCTIDKKMFTWLKN